MNKSVFILSFSLVAGLLAFTGCATKEKTATAAKVDTSFDGIELEKAIEECTESLVSQLQGGRVVAVLDIETPTSDCSKFIVDEVRSRIQKAGFTMSERQNIQRILDEITFQNSTGLVSDDSAARIGHFHGAQNIVFGSLEKIGGRYRLTLNAAAVEGGNSIQEGKYVNSNDRRLKELLDLSDINARIESAMTELASGLDGRTLIGIDRIGYANTGSVTELSRFLETKIQTSATRLRNRYAVAGPEASIEYMQNSMSSTWVDNNPGRIMAMVKGNFTPIGNDAEVTLNMISTDKGKRLLNACQFTITEAELKRLNLKLIPDNYERLADYQAVQRKLSEFDTTHNRFEFQALLDRPDAMYRNGDYMSFKIHSSEDCWFLIQGLQLNGEIVTLYPTETREVNFIKGGDTRTLPDRGRFRLGGPPFGEEYILISAFKEQITIPTEPVKLDNANLKTKTRAIAKEEYSEGSVNIDVSVQPVARAKFSYTITR